MTDGRRTKSDRKSSPCEQGWAQIGCPGDYIMFSVNEKITKNQFDANPTFFFKSPMVTTWQPSWTFYENESSMKSPRTPICSYILGFVKIGLFLRKLEILRNAPLTYYTMSAETNSENPMYLSHFVPEVETWGVHYCFHYWSGQN